MPSRPPRPPEPVPGARAGIPHVLLVGARSEILAKLVGTPVAITAVRRPGGWPQVEAAVTRHTVDADVSDAGALLAAAGAVHARRPLDAVVAMTESALLPASLVGEALGVRVDPSAAVALALDKAAMRRHLAALGLDATAHRVCGGIDDAAALLERCPTGMILKPVDGAGGTGVHLVRDPAELERAWVWTSAAAAGGGTGGSGGVLAEEYLVGRELSVETVSADGEHRVLAVTGKRTSGPPHFVEVGHDLPARLTPAEHALVTRVACDALAAIGHRWGPGHTEVMVAPERATVVEINTRVGGDRIWEMVELATGVSLPHAIVEALTRGTLPAVPSPRAGGGAAVRFLVAAPGRVAAVSGVDEALGVPGVLRVGDLCRPGDAVPPLSDSHGRVGHVLAVGADAEQAAAAADRAVALIAVDTVDTVEDAGTTARTAGPR